MGAARREPRGGEMPMEPLAGGRRIDSCPGRRGQIWESDKGKDTGKRLAERHSRYPCSDTFIYQWLFEGKVIGM